MSDVPLNSLLQTMNSLLETQNKIQTNGDALMAMALKLQEKVNELKRKIQGGHYTKFSEDMKLEQLEIEEEDEVQTLNKIQTNFVTLMAMVLKQREEINELKRKIQGAQSQCTKFLEDMKLEQLEIEEEEEEEEEEEDDDEDGPARGAAEEGPAGRVAARAA